MEPTNTPEVMCPKCNVAMVDGVCPQCGAKIEDASPAPTPVDEPTV